jgi:hypothetical protein
MTRFAVSLCSSTAPDDGPADELLSDAGSTALPGDSSLRERELELDAPDDGPADELFLNAGSTALPADSSLRERELDELEALRLNVGKQKEITKFFKLNINVTVTFYITCCKISLFQLSDSLPNRNNHQFDGFCRSL